MIRMIVRALLCVSLAGCVTVPQEPCPLTNWTETESLFMYSVIVSVLKNKEYYSDPDTWSETDIAEFRAALDDAARSFNDTE